jgi:hypothetical protein
MVEAAPPSSLASPGEGDPLRLRVVLGAFLTLVALGVPGASVGARGSWDLAQRIPSGTTVSAATAGDLTLHLQNSGGVVLAGVNADGSDRLALTDLAAGQALVAWTAPIVGGGQEVVGVARNDVAAVLAVFADGTTRLLALDTLDGFADTNRDAQLTDLQAIDATGSTVGEIAVPPTAPSCAQTVCRILSADRATATAPLYGLFSLPDRGHRVVGYGGRMMVSRVDPNTLSPVGKRLPLPEYFWPQALSPDGTRLLGSSNNTGVSIIDLQHLTENTTLKKRLQTDLGSLTSRAAAWPTDNRVIVLAQGYSEPYHRNVAGRTLLGIDPSSGSIVWRHKLTNKLGLFGTQTVGGKLVLLLGDSSLRRTTETIVVVSPTGQLRSSTVDIPRVNSRFQEAKLLGTNGRSPAAYLVSASGTIFSIDLDTARATDHTVKPPPNAPANAPGMYTNIPAAATLGNNIVATGLFTRSNGRPRTGIYLFDTTTWTAQLVDRDATRFATGDNRIITYTGAVPPIAVSRPGRELGGTGITIYDQNGARLHHLYGERKFLAVGFAPSFAYAFTLTPTGGKQRVFIPQAGKRLLFDPATGKSLGNSVTGTISSPRLISPTIPLVNG